MTTTHDQYVMHYQETGDSEPLVSAYKNFLNKYSSLLWNDTIDYGNYDVRCFLSCFIKEKTLRASLRKGKFHSSETVQKANKVLQYLRFKLRKHSQEEIDSEILIPFLHCATVYKQQGRSFEKYLYVAYKFALKRHLDNIQLDMMDQNGLQYRDMSIDTEWKEDVPEGLIIHYEEEFELTHPDWIHGDKSSAPFSGLKPHERYILAKYYYEDYTDREISRMLPYNPKSIHRIRMRLKKHFESLYHEGELKWIRM